MNRSTCESSHTKTSGHTDTDTYPFILEKRTGVSIMCQACGCTVWSLWTPQGRPTRSRAIIEEIVKDNIAQLWGKKQKGLTDC